MSGKIRKGNFYLTTLVLFFTLMVGNVACKSKKSVAVDSDSGKSASICRSVTGAIQAYPSFESITGTLRTSNGLLMTFDAKVDTSAYERAYIARSVGRSFTGYLYRGDNVVQAQHSFDEAEEILRSCPALKDVPYSVGPAASKPDAKYQGKKMTYTHPGGAKIRLSTDIFSGVGYVTYVSVSSL